MSLEDLKRITPDVVALMALPSIPSPRWFTGLFSVGTISAIVSEAGTVEQFGDLLRLVEGELPAPGTPVTLSLRGNRVIVDIAASKKLFLVSDETVSKTPSFVQKPSPNFRQKAVEANSKLNIPVRWTSGQKKVLSGLMARSAGTGENVRTVNHVLLLENIDDGRLKRHANGFLCTTSSGSNGEFWTGYLDAYDSDADGKFVSRITCKQCLSIAERWRDHSVRVEPEVVSHY